MRSVARINPLLKSFSNKSLILRDDILASHTAREPGLPDTIAAGAAPDDETTHILATMRG